MAAGKINLQKASGGITVITGVDGTGNTQLVLPESGTVATTASVIGLGQTWQNVTANRTIGATYTNTTGKPIFINICMDTYASYQKVEVGGIDISGNANMGGGNPVFVVPNGSTYKFVSTNIGILASWCELR